MNTPEPPKQGSLECPEGNQSGPCCPFSLSNMPWYHKIWLAILAVSMVVCLGVAQLPFSDTSFLADLRDVAATYGLDLNTVIITYFLLVGVLSTLGIRCVPWLKARRPHMRVWLPIKLVYEFSVFLPLIIAAIIM